jgi:aspartyl-tRNA(Asn)/glutamyl-tRNA(Gln) amidotransferase subunit C
MKLSPKEIKYIAELARLELSEAEEKKFATQLTSILDYVKMLDEVKVDKIEPAAPPSGGFNGLSDVWRVDEIKAWPADEISNALSQGELEDGFVKVKRVL